MSKKSTKSGKKKNNLPYSEKKLIEQKKQQEKVKAEKKEKISRIIIPAVALIIVAVLVALIVILSTREQPKSEESSLAESSISESSVVSEVSDLSSAEESVEETKQELGIAPSHIAEINIKDYGTIKLELFSDAAPITVANFVKLANEGFYDGLTFHRIMKGFMMQGGDPNANGTGGSGENIKGEFSLNGWENPISHLRGVISMARTSSDMDSASSQFFIVHKNNTEDLDGKYASFGRVTDGMDIVDKICNEAQPTDNNGTIPKDQQPVISSITVREVTEADLAAASEASAEEFSIPEGKAEVNESENEELIAE